MINATTINENVSLQIFILKLTIESATNLLYLILKLP